MKFRNSVLFCCEGKTKGTFTVEQQNDDDELQTVGWCGAAIHLKL